MNKPTFRLLNDFQAGYIKFNGREPTTLRELALALADGEYKRRLAEIKVMSKRLELLDAFLPALAERGIRIWPRDIHSQDLGKGLRIYPGIMNANDDKLHKALLELGFFERGRTPNARDETVTLQHGRWLVLVITVSKIVPPAEPYNV